jgi:aminoglycoside/choline kinase family phosphotransferase
MTDRLAELSRWLRQDLGLGKVHIAPASSDASFRRYFRVDDGRQTWIAMDAPPAQEDSRPFVAIARGLRAMGLNAPQVHAEDHQRGFLLLSDLGASQYLQALDEATVDRLYGDALGALLVLQACGPEHLVLPSYDEALLLREMELFAEWLMVRYAGIASGEPLREVLGDAFALLARNALEQPQVCVHRDFHSRNLMVVEKHNPGILDFQGALMGPVTYDLVSLLKDCYIAWPRRRVEEWALGYQELALQSGVLRDEDEVGFLRWLDLMGVQRHLKAAGIFARLHLRDGKSGFLQDIPRTLGYVVEVCGRYPGLHALGELVEGQVLPALPESVAVGRGATG